MARLTVSLDGRGDSHVSPLLMHNERLADPLDPISIEIAKLSRKRSKTEADHLEIARLEFAGGMYFDEELGPVVPAWNIIRSIQDAAKRHKFGTDVLRALIPIEPFFPVQYDGPRTIAELWDDGRFASRKSVGVSRRRVMRTRPVFVDWQVEGDIEIDLTVLDVEKVNQFIDEAGRYIGLCDNRPLYGRFKGQARLASLAKKRAKEAVAA